MALNETDIKQVLLSLIEKNKTISNEILLTVLDGYDFKDKDKAYEQIIAFLSQNDIEIIEENNKEKISNDRRYDSTDGLSFYIQGQANLPPLSKQEELQLGKLIYESKKAREEFAKNPAKVELKAQIDLGKEARDKLARCNLRLVVSVAKSYSYTKASFDDMVSEGYVGLVTAIDKYDYRKGFKFSTYAIYWIRQSIIRYIKKSGYAIRLPISLQNKINKVRKAQNELILEKGRTVTYEEIANYLGEDFTSDIVKECLIYASQTMVSLDATQKGKTNEEHDLYDVVSNNEPGIMEKSDAKEEIINKIRKGLSAVSEKEQDILKRYYGINCEPMTLGEIGKLYNNVSKERIRQIKDLALKKIKRYLKNN